ncbi:retrovirus-related Pol polyprotein from transposon 412 [Trichonephila clavipes]|uniref:RNA-directed DNA polymerase n=1 Tax=Trichonephila clavipes TaxID=2585209 RepID=A0A8X6RV35_TRICX|nr:retrovirus-related Pol polyprotein from transposon 412 [Trichonephila clavipes]
MTEKRIGKYTRQFSIISEANGWTEGAKAYQLTASFRGEAAEVLQTLPDTERLNLNSLYNALDLRFGQKYSKDYARLQIKTRLQKTGESLQEYASEVEKARQLGFLRPPSNYARSNLFTVFRGRPEGRGNSEGWARVTADAPCESPWRKGIEKLREEIQDLMAQRQNLRRRRIMCWGCGGAGHLRSSCPRINKEDHNIKCWGAVAPGINRKGSADETGDVRSKRPCSESSKNLSNSWRVEKKFGVIDLVVRQVTTPSTSALNPWSDERVRKDQLADTEIKPIIEFKESSDEKPSCQDIAPFHSTTKCYCALWDSLHLRNGVLYIKCEFDDGKTFSPTAGHFGVMKTLQKVRERFYWNNVRSDVEKGCHICDPCVARKGPRKRTKGRLQLHNVGAPFERIAFDILGPLPKSSDGNNNILVVMDYFTKWPEAYPIPDQEASTVAEVLVQHWISRFGVPLQLHSDQGRNFDSAVCKRLYEILATDKNRTTALHPQSDGMVERFNRTILNSLFLLVSSNQQDWDKKLPFFLLAYRSAVHETTGYSPSQMLF